MRGPVAALIAKLSLPAPDRSVSLRSAQSCTLRVTTDPHGVRCRISVERACGAKFLRDGMNSKPDPHQICCEISEELRDIGTWLAGGNLSPERFRQTLL